MSNPQAVDKWWITNARVVTPAGLRSASVGIRGPKIAVIGPGKSTGKALDLSGAYLAPGFIDLHVWGDPQTVSRYMARFGTTAFLTTLGPEPKAALLNAVRRRASIKALPGAGCLGIHLEGPFVNAKRAGALPARWMRKATAPELRRLQKAAQGGIRLVTVAPELPGALAAIRRLKRERVVVSLGHSLSDEKQALRAADAGARAVTHVFNGMRPFHHREATLVDAALSRADLTTMVILDGKHVGPSAFRLLVRAKGAGKIALVTDSIRFQPWNVRYRGGAYRTRSGILAGSALTLAGAVKNATRFAGLSIPDAVNMASAVPARLLGMPDRGVIRAGARADLVAFDKDFRVLLTVVGGRIVYRRAGLPPLR